MHSDENRLATADEQAELAVLEAALAERLDHQVPPDLWPQLGAATATAKGRGQRPWLAAACLLLGLGAGAVWAVSSPQPSPPAAATAAGDEDDPSGPRNLAELQQRLAAASAATVRVRGTWHAGASRWFRLPRQPLDDLLRSQLRPTLDTDDVSNIVAAIRDAHDPRPAGSVIWTHELAIERNDAGGSLLLQVGGGPPPRIAFRGPDGAVEFTAPSFPFASLQPELLATTKKTIAQLGFVVGADGFAAVPTASRSLRLLEVPAKEVNELRNYQQLTQLDLGTAPAWHDAAVLAQLPRERLQVLTISPAWLPSDAYPLLAGFAQLRELFLVGGDGWAVTLGTEVAHAAPRLDDQALASLRQLPALRELALAGGSFGDDALASLASRSLTRLAVIECANVRGTSLGGFAELQHLLLRGSSFAPDVLQNAAAAPKLKELNIFAPNSPIRLTALPSTRLQQLLLNAHVDRSEFAQFERASELRVLGLQLTPPLTDDDLVLLRGCRQLLRLKLGGDLLTSGAIAALQAALPDCKVSRDFP